MIRELSKLQNLQVAYEIMCYYVIMKKLEEEDRMLFQRNIVTVVF